MKFWGAIVLLLGAGCRGVDRPRDNPGGERHGYRLEGREYVDRLRVEADWRPPPTGGQCVSTWHELSHGSYIAQGWGWAEACYRVRPVYGRGGCRPIRDCD